MLDKQKLDTLVKLHRDHAITDIQGLPLNSNSAVYLPNQEDLYNKDSHEDRSDADNCGYPLNSEFQENLPNQDNLPNKDFHEDRFVRAKYVRNRFSISNPTLHRWVKAGKLPRPQYLNTQRVWRLSVIEAAEQQMLASEERVDNHF